MQVVSLISTKGGVGKTTTAANLGGFVADAGLRVLLLDLDVQPTLSSYFALNHQAPIGTYELLAMNEQNLGRLISHTSVHRLDLILSNDPLGQLGTLLLHAPDGRLRLRNLLPTFQPYYDLLLIDTQGARSVLLEMAMLASDLVLSPVTPEILAARELRRGTLQLLDDLAPYRHLGIQPPPMRLLINRVHPISIDALLIHQALRQAFGQSNSVQVLDTTIPAIDAYPRAATRRLPVHQVEPRKPSRRLAPAALETMRALASELFPAWQERFATVNRRAMGGHRHGE
ncbi:ParA family protein [Pseudomonas sp. MWU12-2037]|uniref:ParA family protein n=1 Tax=Pseudomonas sp. MWU12-2037 TaxID=2928690 RepID=UPI0020107EC0|nr:ParA family protein [Pseudomonas sp. MWU12-2037]